MASLSHYLGGLFSQAFADAGLPGELGAVVPSERPDLGQFQCNGALAAAKAAGLPPRQIAESIVKRLSQRPELKDLSLAGPGFINISVSDAFLAEWGQRLFADTRLGVEPAAEPRKIIMDFSGANVAKSLHIGHLRPNAIGDSLQRLYRFIGHEVYSDTHLGDWGTPMGMLIAIIGQEQPNLPYFDPGFSGPYPAEPPVSMAELEVLYPKASARFKAEEPFRAAAQQATVELQSGRPGYRSLWEHFISLSVKAVKDSLDQLDVHLDWWYGESRYHDRIPALLEKLKEQGTLIASQGAWIIPLGEDIPPLLTVKSDGGYLYATTDLAAIEERVQDDKADAILYAADQRQSLHFRQLFRAARLTGLAPDRIGLTHIGFGTINGPDGKPLKTRAGGLVKLQDVIDQTVRLAGERMQEAGMAKDYSKEEQEKIALLVARAALKFADLSTNYASDYNFDLEKFVSFEGKTGPYLLYTAVRIKSIFRKVGKEGSGTLAVPGDLERDLYLALADLPRAVHMAADSCQPNILCDYAYDLAQKFNRFYQECSILREPDAAKQDALLTLSAWCLRSLETMVGLLGITAPERM